MLIEIARSLTLIARGVKPYIVVFVLVPFIEVDKWMKRGVRNPVRVCFQSPHISQPHCLTIELQSFSTPLATSHLCLLELCSIP